MGMDMNLKIRAEAEQEEKNRMFLRSLWELEEQACLNRLRSGMSCEKYCDYYGKEGKCHHPEQVFPQNQKRY